MYLRTYMCVDTCRILLSITLYGECMMCMMCMMILMCDVHVCTQHVWMYGDGSMTMRLSHINTLL